MLVAKDRRKEKVFALPVWKKAAADPLAVEGCGVGARTWLKPGNHTK